MSPLELVKTAIPLMIKVFQRETDLEILTDVAWALSYLSRERFHEYIGTGIIPSLVSYLK